MGLWSLPLFSVPLCIYTCACRPPSWWLFMWPKSDFLPIKWQQPEILAQEGGTVGWQKLFVLEIVTEREGIKCQNKSVCIFACETNFASKFVQITFDRLCHLRDSGLMQVQHWDREGEGIKIGTKQVNFQIFAFSTCKVHDQKWQNCWDSFD